MRLIKVTLLIMVLAVVVGAQSLPRWPSNSAIQVAASSFNDKERQRIKSAIEAWRPLLPKGLTIDSASTGNVTIVRQATKGDDLGETTIQPYTNGATHSARIRIDPDAGSGEEFQRVVEHELGHLLGLDHRNKSIMEPTRKSVTFMGIKVRKPSQRRPDDGDRAVLALLYPTLTAAGKPLAKTATVISTSQLILQAEPPSVPTLVIAHPSTQRFSFRRIVTHRDKSGVRLVRSSTFTFNDKGRQIETDVIQTGKMKGVGDAYWRAFPAFPICVIRPLSEFDTGLHAPLGYFVVWTDEDSDVSIGSKLGERFRSNDLPWFAEKVPSGLTFPVYAESADGSVFVRFYYYRLFRTSVVVTPIE